MLTQDNDFLFLLLNFNTVFQNSTPEKNAHVCPVERDGISAIEFEAAKNHFLSEVFAAVTIIVA